MPKKNYNKPEASKKQLEQELLEVSEAFVGCQCASCSRRKGSNTELLSNLSHEFLRASMTALFKRRRIIKIRP